MKHLTKIHAEFIKQAKTYADLHIDNFVTNFLRQYPDPTNREFEDWVRRMYVDKVKAYESIYRLATKSVS